MAVVFEIRERHKQQLTSLLTIKKANQDKKVEELSTEIARLIAVMEQEDVALVEKLIGVKALA
jgi:uncharacterized coiled-coil protein SlyX